LKALRHPANTSDHEAKADIALASGFCRYWIHFGIRPTTSSFGPDFDVFQSWDFAQLNCRSALALRNQHGVDPERKHPVMDPDRAQTLQRDVLQYKKDYGLFVLRACILLNGGAIIALLTAVTHHSDSVVITLATVRFSIVLLVFGLVCAVVAAVFAYLNFERGQSTLSDAKMKRYRNFALACAALSLAFFCAAAIIAVFSVDEAPISETDGQTER
jgi:hypothetical protein